MVTGTPAVTVDIDDVIKVAQSSCLLNVCESSSKQTNPCRVNLVALFDSENKHRGIRPPDTSSLGTFLFLEGGGGGGMALWE